MKMVDPQGYYVREDDPERSRASCSESTSSASARSSSEIYARCSRGVVYACSASCTVTPNSKCTGFLGSRLNTIQQRRATDTHSTSRSFPQWIHRCTPSRPSRSIRGGVRSPRVSASWTSRIGTPERNDPSSTSQSSTSWMRRSRQEIGSALSTLEPLPVLRRPRGVVDRLGDERVGDVVPEALGHIHQADDEIRQLDSDGPVLRDLVIESARIFA